MIANRMLIDQADGYRYLKATAFLANVTSGLQRLYSPEIQFRDRDSGSAIDGTTASITATSSPTSGTVAEINDGVSVSDDPYWSDDSALTITWDFGAAEGYVIPDAVRWATRQASDATDDWCPGFKVYGSHDASDWTLLADVSGVASPGTDHTFCAWQEF